MAGDEVGAEGDEHQLQYWCSLCSMMKKGRQEEIVSTDRQEGAHCAV